MNPSVARRGASVVVAGVGNELRGDDGVGPAVLRLLGRPGTADGVVLASVREPMDLLGLWEQCAASVVVDATRSGAPAGTVRVVELVGGDGDGAGAQVDLDDAPASTHTLGLAAALALARALGTAPARVVLVGIEGEDFGAGADLSVAVSASIGPAAARVRALVEELRACA